MCHDLYAVVQVAGHPVGRTDEAFFLASGGKDKDARMFQIAVDDAADAYRVAHAGDAGDQRTVASHKQVDRHATGRRLVELPHHVRVRDVVDLDTDIGGLSLLAVLDFVVYPVP